MTNELKDFCWEEIESIEEIEEGDCYDISLLETDVYLQEPNFIANGFVVHNCGMHNTYVERKRGREQYEIHPMLQSILGPTYGVMVFQEQIMRILSVVGKIPSMHCEIVRKAISKKKFTVFARYKDMFIENGTDILDWTKEQVMDLWQQVESFSEYGFNKSHSVAYTYISSRLLWLKAHYPLEFFAATLSCEKDDSKIKEYKREVESMEIPIHRVDLNKSKVKFDIVDNAIYMGFANIKGIGEAVAEKIVANQPYTSFGDFLHRFGTDAAVIKPLITLRAFPEKPMALYEYYEYYKGEHKKVLDRDKRYALSRVTIAKDIQKILTEAQVENNLEDIDSFFLKPDWEESKFYSHVEGQMNVSDKVIKALWAIHVKAKRSERNNAKKKAETVEIAPFEDFEPDGNVPADIKELLCEVPQIAEKTHYGFSWNHLLESSDDYQGGRTFADFDEDETVLVRACEVHIIQRPKKKKSKKGNEYYTVLVEDANSQPQMITFWSDDYERFKEELEYWESDTRMGNFLCMRLKKPDSGFNSYTFESPQKQFRWKEIPKEKAKDHRIIVLSRPKLLEEYEKVEASAHDLLISMETYERLKIFEFGD